MGKGWDSDKGGRDQWIAWLTIVLQEVYRVLKPGGSLLVWSIPRTSHWTGTAVENAGFRVIDVIQHIFGSGFPKSADISKHIDKAAGAEREVVGERDYTAPDIRGNSYDQTHVADRDRLGVPITAPATDAAQLWDGWGTALKPAAEFWWLAYKPRDGTFANNALTHGVAGLWVDGGRILTGGEDTARKRNLAIRGGNFIAGKFETDGIIAGGHPQGRWPANVIHDGSEEVLAGFPVTTSQQSMRGERSGNIYGGGKGPTGPDTLRGHNDSGSAARYFYCAKAAKSERWFYCAECDDAYPMDKREAHTHGKEPREQKHIVAHPTVKSLSLMRYLVRLTRTPTGGVVLDPFMGTGKTGEACALEGRDFIGIDQDRPAYVMAQRCIEAAEERVAQEHPSQLELL